MVYARHDPDYFRYFIPSVRLENREAGSPSDKFTLAPTWGRLALQESGSNPGLGRLRMDLDEMALLRF